MSEGGTTQGGGDVALTLTQRDMQVARSVITALVDGVESMVDGICTKFKTMVDGLHTKMETFAIRNATDTTFQLLLKMMGENFQMVSNAMVDGNRNVLKILKAVFDAVSQSCFIRVGRGDGSNGSVLGGGNGAPPAPMLALLFASIDVQFKLMCLVSNAIATIGKTMTDGLNKQHNTALDGIFTLAKIYLRGFHATTHAIRDRRCLVCTTPCPPEAQHCSACNELLP